MQNPGEFPPGEIEGMEEKEGESGQARHFDAKAQDSTGVELFGVGSASLYPTI